SIASGPCDETLRPYLQSQTTSRATDADEHEEVDYFARLRTLPIRARILLIAAINTLVAVIFAAVIVHGARDLTGASNALRQARDSDRVLVRLEDQAGGLQNLIHRYFTQPSDDLLKDIQDLREALLDTLKNRASVDPMLANSADELTQATERLVSGFSDL